MELKVDGLGVLGRVLADGVSSGHVYFSMGKGGVGKTTISILASIALRARGKVLLASLDPAKHLIEYLGLPGVAREKEVAPNLTAVQYDVETLAKKAAEDYARLLRQVMPGLSVLNLDGIVKAVRNAPGFEEEVFLRILKELADAAGSKYDYIVIDTPPTGVTHRILNLPRLYLLWLAHLYDLRYKIVSLRYTIARVMGRQEEPHDPVLSKLSALRKEYEELASLLRDHSRASMILIATPEPLPLYELKKTLEVARDIGMKVRAIVMNRVLPQAMAERLGVREVQRRVLEEAATLDCGGCYKLAVMHSSEPPRSLEGVEKLASLVVSLDEALEGA